MREGKVTDDDDTKWADDLLWSVVRILAMLAAIWLVVDVGLRIWG